MFDYNLRINRKTTLRFSFGRLCLLACGGIGILLMLYRMINGLGAASNLSDSWTWGLWIYFDMILSALGSCGFAIGILTHVLHLRPFYPLTRRALFVSFLSYLLVFLILFAEIGRWDNFYWVFISFAWSSPLYEVFICLTMYFALQFLEIAEVWIERYLPSIAPYARYIMPCIFLICCVLPFGQEAALGGIYLAMPTKLHTIWYSQALPLNCLISAFYGGLCFITLEYYVMNRYLREKSDDNMIRKVMMIAGVVIAVNLVIKLIDVSVRGAWGAVFDGSLEGTMFLFEILLGSVLPMILTLSPLIKKRSCMLTAAAFGVLGILWNRFNFIFVGMARYLGNSYVPSFVEWGIVLGLICLIIVVYIFFVENLPILQNKDDKKPKIVVH